MSHLSPVPARRVTATDVADAVLSGAWVVDVRVPGPRPVDSTAYVGWLVPSDDDVLLLASSPGPVAPPWDDLSLDSAGEFRQTA